jgi:hypothetical protein
MGRYPGPDVLHVTPDEYLSWTARKKSSFFGYKSGPIELPKENLPIPPYILGAWLGDGCSDRQSITSMDEEIISAFVSWGESLDCHEARRRKPGQRAFTIILTNVQGKANKAKDALRELGVLNNKHVPEKYHRSTLSDRLEFLAGIIDTDGHYANGCFKIVQKNKGIAESIKRIADSCGFKTSFKIKTVSVGNERRPYCYVSVCGDIDRVPTKLPRKQAVVHKNKDWLLGKLTVESAGEGEYAGFEVEGSLFVLANGIVTHNSHFFAESVMERCIERPGTRIVCVREIQRSLKESVKRLVEDKIIHYDVGSQFRVLNDKIIAPGGGVVLFQGMQDHTAESIKSLEGFDVAYVEEAQTMTARSLEMLRPTIRKDGSELWFSWNPRHPTDPVDALLRGEIIPDNAVVVETSYLHNPFFPEELELERQFDEKHRPLRYGHVWLGEYEPVAIGAIWDRAMIHRNRRAEAPELARIVVAIDPPAGMDEEDIHDEGAECGIMVTGIGEDNRGYLLGDYSMRGKPDEWGKAAVAAFDLHEADAMVAEINQGGDMVEHVIRSVRREIRVVKVRATRGKHVRAEPISALYALDRISHIGAYPDLEKQMCLMTAAGYQGDDSPDRVDALVWGFTELFPKLTPRGKVSVDDLPKKANNRYNPHRMRGK